MPYGESNFIVTYDDGGVSCRRPDGAIEQVTWGDLESVTVEATGPKAQGPNIIWILWGRDRKSGCVFPGGATGVDALRNEMRTRLRNFSETAYEEACKAPENRTYVAWREADT